MHLPAEVAVSVREVVFAPEGRAKDAVLRSLANRASAEQTLRLAAAQASQAAQRLADVIEAVSGQDPKALKVDPESGEIYREIES